MNPHLQIPATPLISTGRAQGKPGLPHSQLIIIVIVITTIIIIITTIIFLLLLLLIIIAILLLLLIIISPCPRSRRWPTGTGSASSATRRARATTRGCRKSAPTAPPPVVYKSDIFCVLEISDTKQVTSVHYSPLGSSHRAQGCVYPDPQWSACCGCWLPRIHAYKHRKAVPRKTTTNEERQQRRAAVASRAGLGAAVETGSGNGRGGGPSRLPVCRHLSLASIGRD